MITINTPNDLLIELLGGIDLEELKYQKKMLASMSGGTASPIIEGILNLLDVITDFMEDHPDDVGRMRVKRKDKLVKEGKI
jgi:hypothetical protein